MFLEAHFYTFPLNPCYTCEQVRQLLLCIDYNLNRIFCPRCILSGRNYLVLLKRVYVLKLAIVYLFHFHAVLSTKKEKN